MHGLPGQEGRTIDADGFASEHDELRSSFGGQGRHVRRIAGELVAGLGRVDLDLEPALLERGRTHSYDEVDATHAGNGQLREGLDRCRSLRLLEQALDTERIDERIGVMTKADGERLGREVLFGVGAALRIRVEPSEVAHSVHLAPRDPPREGRARLYSSV